MRKIICILTFVLTLSCCMYFFACSTSVEDTAKYTVTFVADGDVVGTCEYKTGQKAITEPTVPYKKGYNGNWGKYELNIGDKTVNAVYTPIEYAIVFKADGEIVDVKIYTIETKKADIEEPEVPEKDGYTGVWKDYSLDDLEDLVVEALYIPDEPTTYTIKFMADGQQVGTTQDYTKLNCNIEEPEVPKKDGYKGKWKEYTLFSEENLIVEAEYTLLTQATIKFSNVSIYNKDGEKKVISASSIENVPTFSDITVKDGETLTLPPLDEQFEISFANGGSTTYKTLKWIYVDDLNVIHDVKSGTFDHSSFGNKDTITLYMLYESSESWTGNY